MTQRGVQREVLNFAELKQNLMIQSDIKKNNFIDYTKNMFSNSLIHSQTCKLVHQGCLIIFQLAHQVLSVTVYHSADEATLYKGDVKKSDLGWLNAGSGEWVLADVYDSVAGSHGEAICSISANSISLRIYRKQTPKTNKNNNPHETPTVTIQLTPTKLNQKQSISYIRDYHLTKEQTFKQQILKLKSQIYTLMTQLEHVTGLIRSQSAQAKNARLEIKELKKELEGLRSKERKSSMDCGVECRLSESGGEEDPIISELNSKVKRMVDSQRQQTMNCVDISTPQIKQISIFWQPQCTKENSHPNTLPSNCQLIKQKAKIPRTSSQSYIHANRLNGRLEKTDRLYRMDSIWKSKAVESS